MKKVDDKVEIILKKCVLSHIFFVLLHRQTILSSLYQIMNRLFTIITALMTLCTASAQTGYCTKANDADGQSAFHWNNAKNFCPIVTNADVLQKMKDAGGIKLDMQADGRTTHLYIWENTYSSKSANGMNTFGSNGGYLDLVVNSGKGWSGMGYISSTGYDMSFLTDDYYLHFGTRGKTSTHTITLGGVAFCIGSGSMDGNKNLGCWVDDGEWYYFDIPLSMLRSLGKPFGNNATNYKDNFFTALSGGVGGTELILENVFLYQKKTDDGGEEEETETVVWRVP